MHELHRCRSDVKENEHTKGLPWLSWPKGIFGFLSSCFSDQCCSLFSGLACVLFLTVKKNISPGREREIFYYFLTHPYFHLEFLSSFFLLECLLLRLGRYALKWFLHSVLWQSPVGEPYLSITKEPRPDVVGDCVVPVYHSPPMPKQTLLEYFRDPFFPFWGWGTTLLKCERIN